MTAIRTVEAHGHVGETVEVRGWLHNVRRLGGVTFVVVRDGWGTIQAVTEDEADLAPLAGLALESVVGLRGRVTANDQAPGKIELQQLTLTVITPVTEAPPLPLHKRQLNAALPTLLDHAVVLNRHPTRRAVFRPVSYTHLDVYKRQGKFQPIPLGPLAEIPLIGPVLFRNPPITYLAIILVFVMHYVLFYTRWGLRTRAVGEHPSAADTVGINVYKIRYANVILGGALAGLGGAFLSLEGVGTFERLMTNGRGFLALAIMIFGKWTPLGAWGAALLFGFTYALQTQLQFAGVDLPPQFIGSMPYILTILVLAGFVGRSRAPAASGVPYEKGG